MTLLFFSINLHKSFFHNFILSPNTSIHVTISFHNSLWVFPPLFSQHHYVSHCYLNLKRSNIFLFSVVLPELSERGFPTQYHCQTFSFSCIDVSVCSSSLSSPPSIVVTIIRPCRLEYPKTPPLSVPLSPYDTFTNYIPFPTVRSPFPTR